MFQKRIDELNHADIQRVIADQVQEGSEVEFKEALPAKDGATLGLTVRSASATALATN